MDLDALADQLRAGQPIRWQRLVDDHWPDLDCRGAHFFACEFERVQFTDSIFADARFAACRFNSCRFSHADFSAAEFETCSFHADNKGSSFAFCNLQRAVFAGCALSLAQFDRTEMFGVEMQECNLTGAKFMKADFSRALSRKKTETRASFANCKMDFADLSDVKLPGCSLVGSRLREADLSNADLTDADLTDCDLFQAVLDGARLSGAQLHGAEVSGLNLTRLADFAGLQISEDQMFRLLDAMGVEVH